MLAVLAQTAPAQTPEDAGLEALINTASKITPDIKLRLGLSASFQRNRHTYEDAEIVSTQESYAANGLFVKSLDEHWSVGVALDSLSSTYQNISLSLAPAPAVEFNAFRYSQSTRRQLRFLYKLSFSLVQYRETTIYDKLREALLQVSLSVTLDIKEKWGSISTSLSGSHYFHDFSKNNLGLYAVVQLNIFKGFNAVVLGGAIASTISWPCPKAEPRSREASSSAGSSPRPTTITSRSASASLSDRPTAMS